MELKFENLQLGNVVRIRNDLVEYEDYNGFFVTPSMANKGGQDFRIRGFYDGKEAFYLEGFEDNRAFTITMISHVNGEAIDRVVEPTVTCSVCGGEHVGRRTRTINGMRVCGDCYDKLNSIVGGYHSFGSSSYHLVEVGGENRNNSTFIGAELEVEVPHANDNTRKLVAMLCKTQDTNNIIHYERDGSLDNGFEMITQPMSFKYWQDVFSKDLEKMLKVASDNGGRSHDTNTCGLHFHVGRQSLPTAKRSEDDVIDNIILIVETFKDEMAKFARRGHNSYARYLSTRDDSIDMDFIKENKTTSDRYKAINISNANTIEFRMFKGTLKFETFMASLELVNNIVNIAKYRNIQDLTWNDIIGYHKTTNQYLTQYNETLNIRSTKKVNVLSYYELHKEDFTLSKFIDGGFNVRTKMRSGGDRLRMGKLIHLLESKKLKTYENFSGCDLDTVYQYVDNYNYISVNTVDDNKVIRFHDRTTVDADHRITLRCLFNLYAKYPSLMR